MQDHTLGTGLDLGTPKHILCIVGCDLQMPNHTLGNINIGYGLHLIFS